MSMADMEALVTAHDEVVATIEAIPDKVLDRQPGDGEWSPRYIISHMAHTNEFYLSIIEQARSAGFARVRLDPEPAVQRMRGIDDEIAQRATVPDVLDGFERACRRLLTELETLTPEEVDRPFILDSGQVYDEPGATTLRERVMERAAEHLREHRAQLAATLARLPSEPDGRQGAEVESER